MGNEFELIKVEGNEYKLMSFGIEIATIYTEKDTYAFDIKLMVDRANGCENK